MASVLGNFMDWLIGARKVALSGNIASPGATFITIPGYGFSGATSDITAQISETLAAVYAATHAYSDGISTLPLYVEDSETEEDAKDHPLYPILHDEWNAEQTSQQAMDYMVRSLLLKGNAYAYIRRRANGKIAELLPQQAENVMPSRKNGQLYYETPDGAVYPPDMIHVHINYSPKLLRGIAIVEYAAKSIALGRCLDDFAFKFFTQGAQPRVMLEIPGTASQEQVKQMVDSFNAANAGNENAHKTGALTGGVKLHTLTINPDDAQFLESRKFTVNEVARWFGVPASRIGGDRSSGTYANLEQDQLAFVTHSIRPVCKMFTQEFNRKLLTPAERSRYETCFDTEEILFSLGVTPQADTAAVAAGTGETPTEGNQPVEASNG